MFYLFFALLSLLQGPTQETYFSHEQKTEVRQNQNSSPESTDDSSSEETGQEGELEPNS